MKTLCFQGLLQEDGWLEPAYVSLDDAGRVTRIAVTAPEGDVENVMGYAIPGFHNAHSHAFQYAMAGLAEYLRAPGDDFWSWREAMYHLALTLSPEQVEDVAAMLYAEMVRNGYTTVAEFHYLHHQQDGQPYENLAEMSACLMRAAARAGMKITLVPIYYNMGDFGKEASAQQRRFLSADVDAYLRLVEACQQTAKNQAHAQVGLGIHSLRAAGSEDVKRLFAQRPANTPMHIHIAEQQKEVRACVDYLGARPVAWLADHVNLDAHCHLVHATHLEEAEVAAIAKSGAHAVICPSTEGNLGDGFFELHPFLAQGGQLSIGSDSHVCLSPIEELRWLDYGCRMRMEKRNVVCFEKGQDSGTRIYDATLRGGRMATGCFQQQYFQEGVGFDAVVLDAEHPLMAHTHQDRRLATYIYTGDVSTHLGVLVDGAWIVRDGKHQERNEIVRRFHAVTQHTRSR